MDGQKVFEVLSSMTEDERKRCSFWWLVDSRMLDNDVQDIMADFLYDVPLTDIEIIARQYLDELSAPNVVEVLNSCESSMSEYVVDGYWDEYQDKYYSWFETDIEKFLKGKGYLHDEGK